MAEIFQLLTTSPETFKGGGIWKVILDIHDTVRGVGLGLFVMFFIIGVVKSCGNIAEVKRSYRTQEKTAP
jgi:hypothetical protein